MKIQFWLLLPVLCLAACRPKTTKPEPPPPAPTAAAVAHGMETPTMPEGLRTLFVAATGDDSQDGTAERPLASIVRALEKLSPGEAAKIVLRGGVYRKQITVAGPMQDPPPLWIVAADGEEVIFDGGRKITSWEQSTTHPGLWVTHAPGRRGLFGSAPYFEVWENTRRIRYRKAADPDGVQAWPASVCPLDGDRLLVHVPDGQTPAEVDLWHNQAEAGINITRSNVVLRGMTFQNYVGGSNARALTVSQASHVAVLDCAFINTTMGISLSSKDSLVEGCSFTEVGLGIRYSGGSSIGENLTVRRCVMQSAAGVFAFSDLGEHVRNGIRIYHPADGATIEQCVTAGFWAGLYIKTVSHRDGSRPYHVRNNTFVDTIRSGADHKQPRTFVSRNIIGPFAEASGVEPNGGYLAKMGATLEENYFYGQGDGATGTNRSGPMPFVDLVGGDLHLRPELPLPVAADALGATALRTIHWEPRLAKTLVSHSAPPTPLAITQEPVATASAAGALVTVALSQPVTPALLYRAQGTSDWRRLPGRKNQVVRPQSLAAAAPIEPEIITSWSYLFVLPGDRLTANQTYEFRIEAGEGAGSVTSATGTFTTTGGPKTLHVSATADGSAADGSAAAPFARIQDALDRALPGDTVKIAPGVYTDPVLLQHGGTPEAPLTIQGSGMRETILDGGKQVGTMVELLRAPHVHLADMQIRWFANTGLHVINSPNGRAERLWIWNQYLLPHIGGISGVAFWLVESSDWTVTGCLWNRTENGLLAVKSPRLHCHHNTAFGNIYSGICLLQSAAGSVVTHNSLNFTGNVSLRIDEKDPAAFASLVCDFNNLGARLWEAKEIDQGGTVRKVAGIRPENDFTPAPHYGGVTGSKFIIEGKIGGQSDVFLRMEDWRKFSGKDLHSVFADPLFVDPLKADFRLLSDSPNHAPDGTLIGAFDIQAN